MDPQKLYTDIAGKGVDLGIKVIGAIVLWVVGKWLIGLAVKLVSGNMVRRAVDPTLQTYAIACLTGLLNIILVISILGSFGVQTTSFAAVLAAMGLAIGAAWSGLLAHFAAGIFIIVLRPFKVGDFICGGGVTGTVTEIGPFVCKINTLDNILNIVGNNKIMSENIQNFSINPFRRVDLVAQLNHDADVQKTMEALRTAIAQIPNVLKDPSVDVEVLEMNAFGTKLAVRPYCNNTHYWQVYFDTNEAIHNTGGALELSVPEQHIKVRN